MKKLIALIITITLLTTCATTSQTSSDEEDKRQEIVYELQYGKLLAQKILASYPLLNDQQLNFYVNKIGKSVALYAGRPELEYRFAVLDTDNINAYAAPGGYVFVTKGAIALMDDESELCAVIAHEIGHVNYKHIMTELPPPRGKLTIADRITSVLLAQGAVMSSAFSEVANKAADRLFVEGLKKESEFEADSAGLYYSDAVGYDTYGLLRFLEKINIYEKQKSGTLVYNAHPPTDERIARVKDIIAKENFTKNAPRNKDRFIKEIQHLKK